MKLNMKEIQPYRCWYEYLQHSLNDSELSKKVNKTYYKDWHLNQVKTKSFNQWIKTHEHLFVNKEVQSIKLFENKRTPNTVAVEIPINYTVQRIQNEIGKIVKGLVAKQQASNRFKLNIKRSFQSRHFDWFLWAYALHKKDKYTLDEIFDLLEAKQDKRQVKVKKRSNARNMIRNVPKGTQEYYQKKRSDGSIDTMAGTKRTSASRQNAVYISRNVAKARKILNNVCKGQFPGVYSDH
jgi:hypothetical protein